MLVRENLVTAGAMHACRTTVDPLLATLRAHGLHGFLMDVRDHADNHTAAVADIAKQLGLPDFDGEALRRELLGRRPLVSAHVPFSEATTRVLDTFRAVSTIQKEMSEDAASTYIVSMTQSGEDLLRVLLLGREAGL